MRFDVQKYQLVHFAKGKLGERPPIRIGGVEVKAKKHAKVLGVEIDEQLKGSEQVAYLRKKMKTQRLAIERTLSSVAGPSLRRSRVVYTAAIRAAIGYGSPV